MYQTLNVPFALTMLLQVSGNDCLGRGGCNRSRENPGIAKIGLTPPPRPPILAHWWISRQKVRKFDSRQLTTKRVNQHILG